MSITSTGSITLPHTCPCPHYHCNTKANTFDELDSLFGFRTINGTNGKKIRSQSWCRACRKMALKEKRHMD
ncbi:hypothetical protein Q0L23_30845 (plasmid) [Klebsiella michiganensis]|uniref:hypothetical protein n=1 Tax=Klebsiella michiganensis TaxID=1134687 RepID=UPI00265864A6|nr:hypothetical protein [Klebsiella michiganensis]HBR0915105.1 hypothetical protein [Klebsiella pneumoniae]WKK01184.1 hypothetical protein Q0L46_30090 [Klebsiella michiganensis]WKK03835.1 hypothetical protein Q0L23_29100 [Klebsiella michiganensis]WKK06914.1 hypothetical protein Q0L23_30380 [Klebsiella michiganensis]WKK07061.1 hypothetical protein Q0L23_30845 [Klebsiella michiganensis]